MVYCPVFLVAAAKLGNGVQTFSAGGLLKMVGSGLRGRGRRGA